jgi:hypothetical protein
MNNMVDKAPMTYRKKCRAVQAMKRTCDNFDELRQWLGEYVVEHNWGNTTVCNYNRKIDKINVQPSD